MNQSPIMFVGQSHRKICKISHSLNQIVRNNDNSICGAYINTTTFAASANVKIAFDDNFTPGIECNKEKVFTSKKN